ncbi:uncharacterized protein LOC106153636 [Lingula anatina]|uniref:Uncharacterized protein LOC106153636 n=1 Tax=Lingula anatina TaxID=7574 RepID=A0A1S3HAI9_LINAN|nr:uncharacterized protein LOC106153636 [Lingula anatina]|eukprot:XP_013383090.1 uncharacterized protein LOC106153636 [Lingula anatina]
MASVLKNAVRLATKTLHESSKPGVKATSRFFHFYSPEPCHPIPDKLPKWMSAEEAVSVVRSGMKVFVHGGAATPMPLVNALAQHGLDSDLNGIEIMDMFLICQTPYVQPEYKGIFRSNSFFIGDNCREAVNDGRADFVPIFLSEIPLLFRRNLITLDVALISVSSPDEHGFCTLGPSVDCARAALQNARYIIALVNPNMPRTFGDGMVHMSHFDAMVQEDYALPEYNSNRTTSEVEQQIGRIIATNLVQDGATLQMGIGNIPDAVISALWSHRDLGIHSEMLGDSMIDLVERGAITNAGKNIHPGKIVGGFAVGTKRLYEYMHDNPMIVMLDIGFVNNTSIISQNPKVTAINSCIEIDLTGQVCADSIGTWMYSGVGGQIDFLRGAALSMDGQGKPIIALPSTTQKGESKIVPVLKAGAGVTTSRAHAHYIVTEYGIASLFGKNLRQRAYELIKIAHPDHRETLEKEAFARLKCMPSP